MSTTDSGGRPRGAIYLIASLQLVAALTASAAWLWCDTWHHASIHEMADQLVLDGDIVVASAERIRAQNGSVGSYLSQGWGVSERNSGVAVACVALAAPIITLIIHRRPRPTAG